MLFWIYYFFSGPFLLVGFILAARTHPMGMTNFIFFILKKLGHRDHKQSTQDDLLSEMIYLFLWPIIVAQFAYFLFLYHQEEKDAL